MKEDLWVLPNLFSGSFKKPGNKSPYRDFLSQWRKDFPFPLNRIQQKNLATSMSSTFRFRLNLNQLNLACSLCQIRRGRKKSVSFRGHKRSRLSQRRLSPQGFQRGSPSVHVLAKSPAFAQRLRLENWCRGFRQLCPVRASQVPAGFHSNLAWHRVDPCGSRQILGQLRNTTPRRSHPDHKGAHRKAQPVCSSWCRHPNKPWSCWFDGPNQTNAN